MPPRVYSRHIYTTGRKDADDRLYLSDRVAFAYKPFVDNIVHVVVEGDTLQTIASRYYQGVPRPATLWWIIADFQPDPIHDPTIALAGGEAIIVPSLRIVHTYIFNESRRVEEAV